MTAWQPPEPTGLTEPVAEVLAKAPATGPVRIVTLSQDEQGRPRIDVETAADRPAAATAVQVARDTPGTLAITIDQPVHVAHIGAPILLDDATTAVSSRGTTAAATVTDDTYRSQQWALDTLQAETVWAMESGAGQTVAVLDTGVDGTHPDLAAKLLPGVDFVDGSDGRIDPHGHGTHVAGIIAAVTGNTEGIAGLASDASILPVRVLSAEGGGWASDVANGLIWAVDQGATTANLSLGGSEDDPVLAAAVSYAQDHDVVVVAAAGNSRTEGNPVHYPAAYPGVVAVAATDSDSVSAPFSQTGSYVGVAAPGVSILSTYPTALGGYAYLSGTSMAAPYAAASVALLRAAAPDRTATAVIDVLAGSTLDLGPAGRDDEYGTGLIDPVAALSAMDGEVAPALPGAPGTPTATAGDGSASVSWSAAEANGSPITTYTVSASPGDVSVTVPGTDTSAIVTGLSNGTTYRFTVTATNGVGTGPESASSTAVTPALPASASSTFVSLPPTRLLDTRTGTGAPAAPVSSGGTISVQVTGTAGVPASGVTAVVLNVTASTPSAGGFVTVYPTGQPRPLASNLNLSPGVTVPNLVVVKVGADGKVNLFNTGGTTHLIADLAGFYTG